MKITAALLQTLYIDENKRLREIGLIIGKSPKSVSRYLKQVGIKAREFSTKGLKTFLGKKHSEETKQKIREKHIGKKLSPEHRAKVIKTLSSSGDQTGENNHNWKGGRVLTEEGYILVRTENSYKKEHRLTLEQQLGRQLKSNEEVHHLDGDKSNNDIRNLIIVSSLDHQKIHWADPEKRKQRSEDMKIIRENKFWSSKSRQ